MKLLIDENIPGLFALALHHDAVLLTTDRDFLHSVHFRQQPHPGIILVTLRRPNAIAITEKIGWAMNFLSNQPISSRCLLITDRYIRIYSAPSELEQE